VSVKNLVFRDIFNEIMFGFLVRKGIWSVKNGSHIMIRI